MGARSKNFYNDFAVRLGYEEAAAKIQDLYLGGQKKDAEALVPDRLIDEIALVGTPDRIKEVLGVLNFLAAPFGTQEMLLRADGVNDKDYTLDAKGNPQLTPKGMQDTLVPWSPVVSAPEYFYYPTLPPDPINAVYQAEKTAFAIGVRTPIIGLYSKTNSDKGTQLTMKMNDGLNNIIYGRSPVTSLKQLVDDWRNGGGNDIRSEYEQALQSSKK